MMANIWFQQDGAPRHNTRRVSSYLTERFGDKCIGNNGSVRWPARSLDLRVMETFSWDALKNRVELMKNLRIQRSIMKSQQTFLESVLFHTFFMQSAFKIEGHLQSFFV